MKHFLIKYQFKEGAPDAWRQRIGEFIAALESDPELTGKIAYRVMKHRDGSGFYHLAAASDDQAAAALGRKDFFQSYAEETRRVAGGEVEVLPLELVAETLHRA
jgi:hypothetical protein